MLPNFDPKMENQIGTFDINNKAGKASISFTGGFGWWKNNSEMFTNKVDGLLKDGVKDLECYINSPGGSMFEANEIGNQIERFTGTKTANLGAIVASAASKLTTHFDVVNAAENTQWMMHNPRLVAEFTKATDFDSKKQMFENLRNDTISAYKKKSKNRKSKLGT